MQGADVFAAERSDDPAAYFERASARDRVGALQEQQIGWAVACIHHELKREWTVARLADEVAMSRSAFAACFSRVVGETPLHT